jgi:hypothetical protein
MTDIQEIIIGELRPFLPDDKGDEYYSPLFRGIIPVAAEFQPHFKVDFPAPLLSVKVKYYKRLIDNSIIYELNNLFGLLDNKGGNLILFHRKKLFEKVKSILENSQRYIEHNQYDLSEITAQFADFYTNPQHNECNYIFNYIITALIRCYMEFQSHFIDFIEKDKRFSIADFYTQVLKRQVPQNTCILETTAQHEIEITPIEGNDVAILTAQDNYTRFMHEVQPYQFAELPKYKCLSAENQMRLAHLIVSRGTPYAVAMLHFLEYPERLKAVYSMNKERQYKHIAKCLDAVERSVKGNFLVLNPQSNEDRLKYTATENEQSVKEDYFSLTNKTL